jgi:uroporphyrin-III C-methyltransferase/precorrin-2 dehydrogenase/sirohydrochlorin ferrochelatase
MPRIETKPGFGSVALVGAGPGDPELLTLKAVRVLQSADVVLFDALVSDGVLDLVRREARCLAVGKRGGRVSCRQQDINDLMVKLARQGKRVVRLKAGDPTIFGRAGEEIAQLAAAGIPFEIVPGVTAGLAAAAALGVSLTHRDRAHSVRFVTAHSKNGGLPDDLDWRGLADAETSLVFYMAGRTGPAAARRLMAEGLPVSTPAVVMASVSRPDEERWAGTLAAFGAGQCSVGRGHPVLLCIGRVFAQAAVVADCQECTLPLRPLGRRG